MNINPATLFLKLTLFAFILLVICSCASARYTKNALKFEEAGLYEDAAEYYYEAVKKKGSNVDAKLGLRKTGQQTLEKKLATVKETYKQGNFEEVVYHYIDARDYKDRLGSVGVYLQIPEIYNSYYDEARSDFLNTLYRDGLDKIRREEFEAARQIFEEIKSVDPAYKDVGQQYNIAKFEPIYRNANIYMENEMYRKAYYAFDEILYATGNYKQALALKNEAREEATISILVTGFKYSNSAYKQTTELITSGLKSELLELNNPFISIIDESSIRDNIYKNGKINMQAANLAGIKAILSGKVISVKTTKGKIRKEQKKGYLKTYKRTKNSEGVEITVPEYKKTEYFQYQSVNSAELNIDFSLVSTSENKLIVGDLYKLNTADKLNYAKFDGDKSKLVPGYWKSRSYQSDQDIIKDNWGDVNSLKNLLKADQKVKSTSVLLDELVNQSIQKIVNKIEDYNPE